MTTDVMNPDVVLNPGLPSSVGSSTLPRDANAFVRSASFHIRQTLAPSTEVSALRIMVVDDYPDSADSLAEVLKCLGHLVQVCYDGATALTIATHFRPHVCLLDLSMPGMDGLELAARLKTDTGSGPQFLIATTAFGDLEMRTFTAIAGFHYHFTKPVDISALVEVITKLGELFGKFSPELGPSGEWSTDEAHSLPESL
jgi:two-component system OmpR family response regulator